MSELRQVLPRPEEKIIVRASFEAPWYRALEDKWNPPYKIENIKFTCDPQWRERWVSIQHIGDIERKIIAAVLSPYVLTATYIEDGIFWACFDYLDQRPVRRPSSLPPTIKPVTA